MQVVGSKLVMSGGVLVLVMSLAAGSTGCCGRVRGLIGGKSKGTPTSTTSRSTSTPTGPQPGPGPVSLAFGSNDFTVSTGGRGRVLTFDKDARLLVTFEGLPQGTKLQAGAEEVSVSTAGVTQLRPDVKAALGAASTEMNSTFDPRLTLTVTLPDGRSGNAAVPAQRVNSFSLGQFFQQNAGKSITFDGETPDTKRDTAYITYSGGRIVGRKGLVRDIDLVVTLKKGALKGTKNCSGYKTKEGAVRSVALELFEGDSVAYDRRTGAEVARKTLPPNAECPTTLYQAKDDPTADSHLPVAAAEKWAKTLLK